MPVSQKVEAQISPNIQDFITTPGVQSNQSSDNLLDNPSQVQQILGAGSGVQEQPLQMPSQPVVQPPSQNMPQSPQLPPQPNYQQAPIMQSATPQPFAQVNTTQININPTEIPEFLQNPAQAQKDIEDQMRKAKEELALKEQQSQPNTYQAPDKRQKPQFNNQPSQDMSKPNDMDATPLNQAIGNKKYPNISELLDVVVDKDASDLHLTVGYPPFIRIDDKLVPMGATLVKEDVKTLVSQSLTQNHKELLEVNREVDLSYQHKERGRFRINAYYERGNIAAAYRLIPQRIKTVTDLALPTNLIDFTRLSQGLFLVTGPTGSGKSTTLAALIQYINDNFPKHIITIEDPIEYIYPRASALVDQRELGGDTHSWTIALKSALRQDPDVILIGELRDFDTIQAAITLAETGHLVFATLHTNSAAQSIDRIIDVFPPHQQQQIRTQLAGSLKGILSQRLVPIIGGGRRAVTELLIMTPAVQNLVREGKTYQIDNVVATSADLGMSSLEKSLVKLVREGKITASTAQDYAIRPDEIIKLLKNNNLN